MKMFSRKYQTLFILLLCSLGVDAKGDTLVTWYDYRWKPTTRNNAQFVGVKWKEGDVWKAEDYYLPETKLQMSGSYTDTSGKVRHGLFRWFTRTGVETDSCFYVHGKKQGIQAQWYSNGEQFSVARYNNDIRIDTAINWDKNGKVYSTYIGDSLGNGVEKLFAEDGKIRCAGRYHLGKRTGLWSYKDQAGILSQDITYEADSAVAIACYDESGNPEKKDVCKEEIPAVFRGGLDGWRRYLERNLQYPRQSELAGTEGDVSVQFTVDQEGKPLDISILSSPDEYTGQEALRIMRKAPNWIPAMQYNRKVIYRFVQMVSFRLH
ncbi:MAG: TonB family protein [Bacteroidota bacterium]